MKHTIPPGTWFSLTEFFSSWQFETPEDLIKCFSFENEEKNETLIRARDYLESTKSSSLKISKAQNTTRDEMTAIIFCLMITNPELFHSGNMWNFIKILPSRFKRAGFQMLIVYFKKFLKEKTEYAHDMQTLADRIGFDDEFSALLQINHCSLMTA